MSNVLCIKLLRLDKQFNGSIFFVVFSHNNFLHIIGVLANGHTRNIGTYIIESHMFISFIYMTCFSCVCFFFFLLSQCAGCALNDKWIHSLPFDVYYEPFGNCPSTRWLNKFRRQLCRKGHLRIENISVWRCEWFFGMPLANNKRTCFFPVTNEHIFIGRERKQPTEREAEKNWMVSKFIIYFVNCTV